MKTSFVTLPRLIILAFSTFCFATSFHAAKWWKSSNSAFGKYCAINNDVLNKLATENLEVYAKYDFNQSESQRMVSFDIHSHSKTIAVLQEECRKIAIEKKVFKTTSAGVATKSGVRAIIDIDTGWRESDGGYCKDEYISPPLPISNPEQTPFQTSFYMFRRRTEPPSYRITITQESDTVFKIQTKRLFEYLLPSERLMGLPDISANDSLYQQFIKILYGSHPITPQKSSELSRLYLDSMPNEKMLPVEIIKHHSSFFKWLNK